ncbi:MAG: DNA polymerase III subunit beta [Bacilli bacterium]|nr:DNA polymerase III subunit beta [Bacilli bacterium]
MKLKIEQKVLIENLNYAIKGVSSKNLIPILNCIKFELTNEGLYLTSTDNDIAIKTFIPASEIDEINELGEIVVSGRYIFEIVRKLPNGIINIEEITSEVLYIYTDNTSFKLNCNLVSDFPEIDLSLNEKPIILEQKSFKNIINQTAFAASLQENRPVLTGINLKINADTLIATTTDSYRVAQKKIKLENICEDVNIVIPVRNISELMKMLNHEEDSLELHIFENKVLFKFNNILLMSSLINGPFPDVNQWIPDNFNLEIKVSLNEIYDAIDRASLLTSEAEKNTIKLEIKDNMAIISSNIPEIGNVTEQVQILNENTSDFIIAFSSKYMMDAIKAINSEYVTLSFNGEIQPIIIRNPEDNNLTQLIVPIKIY